MDVLNIANEFDMRSRQSENVIRKVFTRLTENEYVQIRVKLEPLSSHLI